MGQIQLWWLPVFCLVAGASAYVGLARDERIEAGPGRKTALAVELGLVGGVLYWALARYSGLSQTEVRASSDIEGGGLLLLEVGIWALFMSAYVMRRLGRRLRVPRWMAGQVAGALCLPAALCFVAIQLVRTFAIQL